jgi:hypothetical protein
MSDKTVKTRLDLIPPPGVLVVKCQECGVNSDDGRVSMTGRVLCAYCYVVSGKGA